jgi:hypothetical protein
MERVIGSPKKLNTFNLPTIADVMRYFQFIRAEIILSKKNKNPPDVMIINRVTAALDKIWTKADIPHYNHKAIKIKIKKHIKKLRNLTKFSRPTQSKITEKTICEIQNSWKKNLFDISSCKCVLMSCICEPDSRIPEHRLAFFEDQKTYRRKTISSKIIQKGSSFSKSTII